MELLIGNKIKELRRQNNLTQEQLAEQIGISFQAVSKWENNIALPDITLVPELAKLFRVTTDELFSFNLKEMENDIEAYADRAYIFRESDPEKSRKILEEGLEKYPENEILLINLLYVIDYDEYPDEVIKIASRLIDRISANDMMSDIRYDALRLLSYAYHAKGNDEDALAALEQIPEIYFTKLEEMASLLTGDPKYEAANKQKWISFESLIQMMGRLVEYYEESNKKSEAVREVREILALMDAFATEKDIVKFQEYQKFYSKELQRLTEL